MLIRPQSLEIFRVVSYEEALQTSRLFMLLGPAKPFLGLAVDLGANRQFLGMETRVRELAATVNVASYRTLVSELNRCDLCQIPSGPSRVPQISVGFPRLQTIP
jgi:hypothetical protein